MGGPIVMERKGRESIGCHDTKQSRCDLETKGKVRDRGDIHTVSAFPSSHLVSSMSFITLLSWLDNGFSLKLALPVDVIYFADIYCRETLSFHALLMIGRTLSLCDLTLIAQFCSPQGQTWILFVKHHEVLQQLHYNQFRGSMMFMLFFTSVVSVLSSMGMQILVMYQV